MMKQLPEGYPEGLAGFVLLLAIIGFSLWIGGDIQPDLRGDGGYEPCQTGGHPLWQDC